MLPRVIDEKSSFSVTFILLIYLVDLGPIIKGIGNYVCPAK
jgi:hypothetical protein